MAEWARRRRDLVDRLADRHDLEPATVDALETVPRHEFVPESRRENAYTDRPLPIGEGQTISAPHMVAMMTDLLDLAPGQQVLEIGTGRGYHAAVTAEVVGAAGVYSVEYHESLAEAARHRLATTGYGDVSVRHGDGKAGWPARAPFDRAYLTCAAPEFPPAVLDQVRPGGVVLAPIGTRRQRLVKGKKPTDGAADGGRDDVGGSLDTEDHGGVRFVRLQ